MTCSAPVRLHFKPPLSGYLPGEVVDVEMLGIDGAPLGRRRFTVENSPGSGFAGQVYRAVQDAGFLQNVALKVLRPRSAWKQAVRDGLFAICFQTPFAPRFREEALRCSLLWQAILAAAAAEAIAPGAVAQPLGYYWDANLASYVEVHTWIESVPAHYETDDLLVARWFGRTDQPAQTEMARKRQFMDQLAALCHAIGADGLARQYAWYTLVSQANVLSRSQPATGVSPFVAVDCRVGLAFPFFLPFTPVHLRIALDGLRRGALVHYDEDDFSHLYVYLYSRPVLAEQLAPLVSKLKCDDARYRERLPDLWQTRARILMEPIFRQRLRQASIEDWVRARMAAPETAGWLDRHPFIFALLSVLSGLPVLGPLLVRLVVHPGWRVHTRDILSNPAYRQVWLFETRARDLAAWQAEERVTLEHAQRLSHSLVLFLLEKITCAWLPHSFHRPLTDPAAFRRLFRASLIRPLRLLYNQAERTAWLDGIVQSQSERGLIQPDRTAVLLEQIHEPRLSGFVRDLGCIAGLDVVARLVYLLLGIYGISTGDFLPLGLAALGPIPPSGPLRLLYVLGQIVGDGIGLVLRKERAGCGHLFLARLGALLACPWRGVGNLFPILEISAYYPRLALLMADHYASRAVRWVPVFGGRGKLLEYWIFQLCYNIPVGLRKLIKGEG